MATIALPASKQTSHTVCLQGTHPIYSQKRFTAVPRIMCIVTDLILTTLHEILVERFPSHWVLI